MSPGSANFGNFRLFTIETGRFRLDGGAMFGVVPKALWSRHFKSDNKNRILMAARGLLIHSLETGNVYLIDTGIGHKFNEKYSGIYGLDFSEYTLERSLSHHGFIPSDITDIIFTHMHFDHCGGAVVFDENKKPVLLFPKARHWIHKTHWECVLHPNEREKAGFLAENIQPLDSSKLIRLIDDNHVYEPDLRIEVAHGHTPGQQLPLISNGKQNLLFAADLIPTAAHLPLSWVMGFDTRPLNTIEEKKKILARCIQEQMLLYLEHDPHHELITLEGQPEKPVVSWSGQLNDL